MTAKRKANPFYQPPTPWQAVFETHEMAFPALEAIYEDSASGTASFEVDGKARLWQTTFYFDTEPQGMEEVARRVSDASGHMVRFISVMQVVQKDWVSEVQNSFPPFAVGGFFVAGSHCRHIRKAGLTRLEIDANTAFGTGEHATTKGCLIALEQVLRTRRPQRVLDMGCGSAILAIAVAKRWRVPVTAVDIDAISVQVAKQNCRINEVSSLVRTYCGNGYQLPLLQHEAPYDIIVSNILARPLMQFAPALATHLAPGGIAILSGLLSWQENMVLSAHRQQGLALKRRIAIGDWHTLVLQG